MGFIVEIGKANGGALGLCSFTNDGQAVLCGDAETRFTFDQLLSCARILCIFFTL